MICKDMLIMKNTIIIIMIWMSVMKITLNLSLSWFMSTDLYKNRKQIV